MWRERWRRNKPARGSGLGGGVGACLPLRAAVAPNSEVQKPFGVVGVFDLGVEAVRVGGVMVVVQPNLPRPKPVGWAES